MEKKGMHRTGDVIAGAASLLLAIAFGAGALGIIHQCISGAVGGAVYVALALACAIASAVSLFVAVMILRDAARGDSRKSG